MVLDSAVVAYVSQYSQVDPRRASGLFAKIFKAAMFELNHIDKSFRDRDDVIHVAVTE